MTQVEQDTEEKGHLCEAGSQAEGQHSSYQRCDELSDFWVSGAVGTQCLQLSPPCWEGLWSPLHLLQTPSDRMDYPAPFRVFS